MIVRLNQRDFICGTAIAAAGLFAVGTGLQFDLGSFRRIGPGVFPVAIGAALFLLGSAIIAIEAPRRAREDPPPSSARSAVLIVAAIGAFAALIGSGGMVPAVFAAVVVSALAHPHFSLREALLVAAVMSALAVAVFIYGLGFQAKPFGAY